MTVICTQLTDKKTVHATDSLLTKGTPEGDLIPIETGKPKIILVPHFKGAISWWGRVRLKDAEGKAGPESYAYDALEWLLERAKLADKYKPTECQNFAEDLAGEMNYRLKDVLMDEGKGIGLHFSTYEKFGDDWIPELFLITNYTGFTTGGAYPAGQTIIALRQTYHTLSGNTDFDFPSHGEPEFRSKVIKHLKADPNHVFTYNNGHVVQFCHYQPLLDHLLGKTKTPGYEFLDGRPLFIVRTMVEGQERFRPSSKRSIGAPCFDIVIDPTAEKPYSSNSHQVSDFPCGT